MVAAFKANAECCKKNILVIRLYGYTFVVMKAKEKRTARSYKIANKPYQKAMRAAKKKKRKLSQMIEGFVTMVGEGSFVPIYDNEKQNQETII